MPTYAAELEAAREACLAAGAIIRTHYEAGPVAATRKADDSPVTAADLEANDAILALLRARFAGDAILSEETTDDRTRLGRARVWIVDPLDGTRDFVARTGDFAVHVGLSVDGRPAVGAVYQPVGDRLFWAARGAGAFVRDGAGERRLRVSEQSELRLARVAVTRLARTDELARFLEATGLGERAENIGASIKMMALAEGRCEVSICLHGREKEWDTCAPEIIVTEAGGVVTDLDGAPFAYNRPAVAHARGILMTNGPLHDTLAALARPYLESWT
ncbi:MAG TPA: 3'(2'),5'-bisphosphate nucleotidase CysQ [Kofleriaceae bacterium]|nr:3'(2'),5'-bisphosphate nucleotidase CysQ [Kofleriaceae bacterium]